MKSVEAIEAGEHAGAQRIKIPAGLLGLEHIKEFELIENPAEDPFVWLQSAGVPDVAFLMISPFVVMSDYEPDISNDDAKALELESPDDALVLNIVTLRGASAATVNLKGPIVINRRTLEAKQVVLNNAAQYSVRHPIAAG